MTSKKNGKTSTYDPKLYSTCQYIIQNSEKFKEYAILKDRMPFNQETNICLDLHNSLINIFHFLTGEYQKTSKNDAAKGSDVTASLYLNELPEDKLAMVLTLFYEYTHENRKSVGQIFDVNIEKTVPLLNVLIETLNQDYIDNIKEIIETLKIQSGQESMEKNNYNKALNIVYNIYKSEIIKFHHSYFVHNGWDSYTPLTDDISFYHKVLIENNVSSNLEYAKNMRSLERKYPQFRNLKKAYYTWLIVIYAVIPCCSLSPLCLRKKRYVFHPKN